jgi:hypothetical protein
VDTFINGKPSRAWSTGQRNKINLINSSRSLQPTPCEKKRKKKPEAMKPREGELE